MSELSSEVEQKAAQHIEDKSSPVKGATSTASGEQETKEIDDDTSNQQQPEVIFRFVGSCEEGNRPKLASEDDAAAEPSIPTAPTPRTTQGEEQGGGSSDEEEEDRGSSSMDEESSSDEDGELSVEDIQEVWSLSLPKVHAESAVEILQLVSPC